ncbi:histone-lysine N-methyltransferase SETDB1-like [Takifugu rubripes]|uniref:histone-lysine N-methyltransferase SETDB1-like n=1 Tax=Takifugu rubripes TaxID=31033 RepID=UPI0011453189|nr:histone-lysine N-methyltransferase SETDB1-like [Takifugu rubripes]XP_029700820.1 histone-lysine N-methyltransferase SETDB1-like [Takifugu rubripes]
MEELEMTTEAFQKWIRVNLKHQVFMEVEEKFKLLQSLLDRREKLSAHLLQLCRSVARCEALVKKQYSFLGWEYTEPDSGDAQNATGGEVSSIKEKPHAGVLPQGWEHTGGKVTPDRQPVVLLTRLPPCELSSLSLPASQIPGRGHESSKTSDEDEPQETGDSDVSVSSFITLHKRRKREQKDEKLDTSPSTGSEGTGAVGSVQNKAGIKHKERKMMEVTTRPASNKVKFRSEACRRAAGQICVGTSVVARSRDAGWQQGKVLKTVTNEDGSVKYKIGFANKSRSLVSGHHVAFERRPRLSQLKVGTRVVMERRDATPQYSTGILAELPSWKNRMRFLVFLDDHTPHYVALPLLHLVCDQLANPLEEIANEQHRRFMMEYIREWPFLPQIAYMVGETINAELSGAQQECVVEVVDCSLIQVLFLKDQQKDWIYCGSTRLEDMMKLRSIC